MANRHPSPSMPRLRIQRLMGRRRHTSGIGAPYGGEQNPLPWYCGDGTHAPVDPTMVNYPDSEKPVLSQWLNMSSKGQWEKPKQEVIVYKKETMKSQSLTSLFSHSSVPGLREISSSDHISRKIFWFFAFMMLSIMALTDIHQLLTEFYSYPITVDVRLRESRKLPFPAVTVCNLNIVRYSSLCNSSSNLNISIPIELKEKLCGIISNTVSFPLSLCPS